MHRRGRAPPRPLPPPPPPATPPPPPAPAPARAADAPAAPVFALTWQGPGQAKVGDELTVTLRARADYAITNLALQLGFDAQALEVVSVSAGDFLKRGDVPAAFSHSVDPSGGK